MTNKEKGELVRLACDPRMRPSERRRLIRHWSILSYPGSAHGPLVRLRVPFEGHTARWTTLFGLLFGLGVVGGVSFTGGWAVVAWIWSALFGIAFANNVYLVASRARYSRTVRRNRSRFIYVNDLDKNFRPLLIRAMKAIEGVLNSDVYSHGMLDKTANLVAMRQQEWEIATALRDIRALRDKNPRGASGPISMPIETAQAAILHEVENAVSDRVEALERYSSRVRAADGRYRDHQRALKLIELNEEYRDLLARTGTNEQARAEIINLERQVDISGQALSEVITQANAAGDILNLPLRYGSSMAEALVDRARVYREDKRYDDAIQDLDRAIEITPDDILALVGRGETYRQMGHYDEAITDFTRALDIDPDDLWAIERRGLAYLAAERYTEAAADFTCSIGTDPDNSWAIEQRGGIYRQMGRYDEAITDLTRVIELDHDSISAVGIRGSAYRLMGRYDEAITDLTRAINSSPGYTWAIEERGMAYHSAERYAEAIADFTRVIQIKPDYPAAFAQRGETYRLMGRYDEAITDLTRATGSNPGDTWAFAHRGDTYRLMRRYDEAVADLTRAIDSDSGFSWAIEQRGETYRQMGRYDEAITDFTRVMEIDHDSISAVGRRGSAYRLMGRYDEAITDLTRAINSSPGYTWAIEERGLAYRSAERYAEATADLTRVLEHDPSRDDIRSVCDDLRTQF
jgi:tetratricopeptide (TPR) repeat protein